MENVKLTLPVTGKEVVFKPYMTGRDKQAIESLYFDAVKVTVDDAGNSNKEIDTKAIGNSGTNKTIETLVISVDGKTEGVLDLVLDLPVQDYEKVIETLNQISEPISAEEKKRLSQQYTTALVQDGGKVDKRLNIVAICQTMGWTYFDYLVQPSWFLELIDVKMEAEAAAQSIKADITQAEVRSAQNGK